MTCLAGQWQVAWKFFHSEFLVWCAAHWHYVKDFLNSGFFAALAASCAGAGFGAYAAQKIAERSKLREELSREMRITNAAIMVSFSICNTLLVAKGQHIRRLKEDFDARRNALQVHLAGLKQGTINQTTVFQFQADFQALPIIKLPTDILQKQVFESLSVVGRPLSATTTLLQVVDELNSSIEKRNDFIKVHYANKMSDYDTLALYFGLADSSGRISTIYPDLVQAIYQHTDSGIFFSKTLCEDLEDHGNKIASRFKKLFRKEAPKISRPIFDIADNQGLMPPPDSFADWVSMFVKKSDDRDPA